jgi:hypothetical protein
LAVTVVASGLGADRSIIEVTPDLQSGPTDRPEASVTGDHAKRCAELDAIAGAGAVEPPPVNGDSPVETQAPVNSGPTGTPSQPPVNEDRLGSFNEALADLTGKFRDVVRVHRNAPGQWLIEAIETMH